MEKPEKLPFSYQFSAYEPECFEAPGRVLQLSGHSLEYMSFCSVSPDRHPLVLLGGAFQTFSSFKLEVHNLMRRHPVIVLELPGQGRSQEDAVDLSFPDFADLMAGFVRAMGLPAIVPVGLSYGTAMAFAFASRHPELCHKLILSGTTERIRPLLRMQLRTVLKLLDEGLMDEFSRSVVNHLFNPYYSPETGVHPELVESMAENVKRMTPLDRAKYRANTERILSLDGLEGRPECPALIVAAEYDNFTTASDAYGVARRCADATFVLLSGGDHLLPLTKPRLMSALYDEFAETGRLPQRDEVKHSEHVGGTEGLGPAERRVSRRKGIGSEYAVLIHNQDGAFPGILLDIGPDGCLLQADASVATAFGRQEIEFLADAFRLHAVVLADTGGLRCAFIRDDADGYAHFGRFLQRLSVSQST